LTGARGSETIAGHGDRRAKGRREARRAGREHRL